MRKRTCLAIVLAAGEGTRMLSSRPKVMHAIAGRSLLGHVLSAVDAAHATEIAVVVGPRADLIVTAARAMIEGVQVFVQTERRGTAHAVLAAKAAIERGAQDVLVIFGDTPLIRPRTLETLRKALADGAAVAVLGFRPANPFGYGRLVTRDDALVAIVEEADAGPAERDIALCNGGLMAISGAHALSILERIRNDNRKQEYYLTDAVAIAHGMGLKTVALEVAEDEVSGINTKAQLAAAEAVMQQRLRQAALDAGVTLVAPDTVYLAADTKLGPDVTVEPFVVFGPGVTVEEGATIRSFSHLDGAHVGKGAIVGPFARLRPGAQLGEHVHIGNFVEVKEAQIEAGAKANHLTYIGDARVGAGANIGAGTITCNYDGLAKHRTDIGKGAFIGSNSALVAPVTIGEGAYIGSGSVITKNVPPEALAVGRGRQTVKEGWAKRLRGMVSAGKTAAPDSGEPADMPRPDVT
jgi:bifunctional UDP-N-acetylglucosamine pyrophosphorylase/glucosamine-1-phosphate N-acetyltransferase